MQQSGKHPYELLRDGVSVGSNPRLHNAEFQVSSQENENENGEILRQSFIV
jgi:hypothetical protein